MNGTKHVLRVCVLGAVLLSAVGTAAFAQSNNTAYGTGALQNDTTGDYNSAFGFDALYSNTVGWYNTASGASALFNNSGYYNTASGASALGSNTTGSENTATGYLALASNTTAEANTATGMIALNHNTTGDNNTADGLNALYNNTTGSRNTAGVATLYNSSGDNNIAIGYQSGFNTTTGSNNIEIGSLGVAADANTIRIGTQGTQKATYIAGIRGAAIKGVDMVVSSSGLLGILKSSLRYKRDIQPLNQRSQGLWQLRPVTFRYKQDPEDQRQYGLIAEEVAKVYPELVIRGDKGAVESVQYRELIPLMLNEMQRERNEMQRQYAALTELKTQNQMLRAALASQNAIFITRLERLERTSRENTVASR